MLDDLDLVHTIEDDVDSDFGSDDDTCGDGGELCLTFEFLLPHFVRTDGMVGLTMADAAQAVQILRR